MAWEKTHFPLGCCLYKNWKHLVQFIMPFGRRSTSVKNPTGETGSGSCWAYGILT